jgi:hypothetical protein
MVAMTTMTRLSERSLSTVGSLGERLILVEEAIMSKCSVQGCEVEPKLRDHTAGRRLYVFLLASNIDLLIRMRAI